MSNPGQSIVAGSSSISVVISYLLYKIYKAQYKLDFIFQEPILQTNGVRSYVPGDDAKADPDDVTSYLELKIANPGKGTATDVHLVAEPDIDHQEFNCDTTRLDLERKDAFEDETWVAAESTVIREGENEAHYLSELALDIHKDSSKAPREFDVAIAELREVESPPDVFGLTLSLEFENEAGERKSNQILDFVLKLDECGSLEEALTNGIPANLYELDKTGETMKSLLDETNES